MKFSDVKLPSNRKFGFFFAAVFAIAGFYFFSEKSVVLSYALSGLSALFIIVTFLKADLLLPLNKLWMRIGLLLGMIVSPIVLGILFFGLFTPISLLMKLFGRDELRLKLKVQESHWKLKDAAPSQPEGFKQQF
jgi:polyferredoxin